VTSQQKNAFGIAWRSCVHEIAVLDVESLTITCLRQNMT